MYFALSLSVFLGDKLSTQPDKSLKVNSNFSLVLFKLFLKDFWLGFYYYSHYTSSYYYYLYIYTYISTK